MRAANDLRLKKKPNLIPIFRNAPNQQPQVRMTLKSEFH